MNMDDTAFEDALNRLESIIATLGDGDAGLEEILRLFEEGTELIQRCQTRLDQAEARIVELSRKLNAEQGANDE
jgi:exodeoxyribonuclease VII small subunit